MTRLFAT